MSCISFEIFFTTGVTSAPYEPYMEQWSNPNVLELSFVSISTLPEKLKTASALTTYWRCCPLSCVMWTLIQQLRQTERRTPMTSFITRKKSFFDLIKRARIGDFIHFICIDPNLAKYNVKPERLLISRHNKSFNDLLMNMRE